MKNHSIYIILILLLNAFSSCNKEIDLDLPPYDSKIVVNGEFNNNNVMQVEISKSIPILDVADSSGYLLLDATAVLYEDNVKLGNMTYGQLLYNFNVKPKPGKKYRIEVSRKGLPTVSAEVEMPELIQTNATYKDSIGLDNSGFKIGQLNLQFKDAVGTSNYYQLSIRTYSSGQNTWYPLDMESNDPVFINNTKLDDGSYIFSDATFNGQLKSISFKIPDGTVSSVPGVDKFEISIKMFSSEYYSYLQQVRDYSQNGSSFDTEPIIMKSNVTNGLGMVGGVCNAKDTLR